MKLPIIATILWTIHVPGMCGTKELPRDIRDFIANARGCEHLSGEYDGELPREQKREIERNVRTYCGSANRQLRALPAKYRNDPALLEAIRRNANEAVTDYEP